MTSKFDHIRHWRILRAAHKNQIYLLLSSVQEMDAILKGEKVASRTTQFAETEIIAIRQKTGLTQSQFAALIGVSQRTLENWEQGRRRPTGPAKVLLRIFDADPAQTVKTLHR